VGFKLVKLDFACDVEVGVTLVVLRFLGHPRLVTDIICNHHLSGRCTWPERIHKTGKR